MVPVRSGACPQRPLTLDEAFDQVDRRLAEPSAVVVEPGVRHTHVVRERLVAAGGGDPVNDARLAALAIQHRGRVVSFDRDFDRFPGLSWEAPPPVV